MQLAVCYIKNHPRKTTHFFPRNKVPLLGKKLKFPRRNFSNFFIHFTYIRNPKLHRHHTQTTAAPHLSKLTYNTFASNSQGAIHQFARRNLPIRKAISHRSNNPATPISHLLRFPHRTHIIQPPLSQALHSQVHLFRIQYTYRSHIFHIGKNPLTKRPPLSIQKTFFDSSKILGTKLYLLFSQPLLSIEHQKINHIFRLPRAVNPRENLINLLFPISATFGLW